MKLKFLFFVFLFVNFLNADSIKQALDAYVINDVSRAMRIFANECEKNNLFACTRLGLMYEYGENAKIDLSVASKYFKKACDGGDIGGCEALNNLGKYNDNEAKFNYMKDKDYSLKIENDKFTEACDAYMLLDNEKAFALFENLCSSEDMTSCARVGLMYEEEIGVKSDLKIAKDFYQKACDAEDGSGCGYLAIFYEDGNGGVDKNYEKADEFYTKACELGFTTGCYNLAVMYDGHKEVESDYEKAIKYYNIACNQGDSWGCGNLGFLYDYGSGVK